MRRARVLAIGWSLVLPLCALCGGAIAGGEPLDDPAAFEKGYAAVQNCHKRGQPKKGLKALKTLLARHEGRDYARMRRAEIEDLARRLSFRAEVKQPDPRTLVTGKLLKWKPSTGEIKVHYKRKACGDLRKSKTSHMRYFPARVRGPFKLEVRGRSYPNVTKDSPRMLFGGDECKASGKEVSWQITFGVPPYTEGANEVWMPARITRYDGDDKMRVCEKEITPAKARKPYKLVLTVTRTSIIPTINGKPIGKAKKPKEVYGSIGFEATTWTDMILSGKIEPSWMQEKIDEVVQAQRMAFEKAYRPRDVLPAWLFEAPATSSPSPVASAGEGAPGGALPAEIQPTHYRDLTLLYVAIAKGDFGAGLETVARMQKRGAPESVCAFLSATLQQAAGETKKALEAISTCTKLAPDFLLGWVMQGTLLRRLGRHEEAAEAFLAGIGRNAHSALGYEMAALTMLYAGEIASARKFVREAAGKGVSSKKLSQLSSVLVKAENGPTFSRVFEYKSRNYHVVSDIGKSMCVEASKVLEKAFTSYRVNFGWVSRDKTRLFKVYLFGGRAGFMNYQKDLGALMGRPSERAAGLYSPLLKQLLIWNLPSREEMIKTIRHEGFHQYLDRVMPDPPTWFNEGLAVYHEHAELKSGRLTYGVPIGEYVELLEEEGLVPLEQFLFVQGRKFYEGSHKSYGQAWAFMHMLKHGSTKRRDLFKQLVKDFQTDEAPREVLRRAFPAAQLKELDEELEAHLEKLAGA